VYLVNLNTKLKKTGATNSVYHSSKKCLPFKENRTSFFRFNSENIVLVFRVAAKANNF